MVTESPCNTGKNNFNASYLWGEPPHLALASNSACGEVIVGNKSLDSAHEAGGSILERPQKTRYSVRVLGQAADHCPGDPQRCFPSTGQAVVIDKLPETSVQVHCRETGSWLVIPLGLI